ncbi:MAG: gliding motility-associated C-terminal domain-containing protein, partial [Bacteroidota bacterium]
ETRNTVNGCTSSTRTAITITQNPLPAAPGVTSPVVYCEGDTASALTATGTNLLWYTVSSGGTGSATAPTPSTATAGTTSYYVSQTNANGCEGPRAQIDVTINALPVVVANATTLAINAGEPVTLTGSGADSYVWDNGVTDGDTVFPLTDTTYIVIGTDLNGCQNTDSVTITVAPTSDLSLGKTVSNANPNVGDNVTFILTVDNAGPIDAPAGTIVNDMLPAGYTFVSDTGSTANGTYNSTSGDWTLPAISVGTSVSINLVATVNAPTNVTGEYENIAQVTNAANFDPNSTPNNDDGDQSEDDEDSALTIPQVSDLELTYSISDTDANPGDILTLTLSITNNGPNDASGVTVESNIPSGFTVSTVNNGGAQSGSTIVWSGLNIPTGTTTVLTFDVSVNIPANLPDEYVSTAQVMQADQFDSDSTPNNDDGDQSEDDEDRTSITLIPADLSLTKTLSGGSLTMPNAGDTVVFELTLENSGPGLATNVTIVDTLPIGYTLGTVNNGGLVTGNTITWSFGTVPVGTQVVSYEVTVNAPTNSVDEYRNVAEVTTSDMFDPDSTPGNDDGDQSEDDEVSFSIDTPTVDLEVIKTVDKTESFFGDTVIFTIQVTNNSSYEATNIGIEDELPAGYEYVSSTALSGTYDVVTSTWDIPSIAPGASTTLEIAVNVTETDDYVNVAELIYVDQIDPNMANDRDEATLEITQSECLTVYNEITPNEDGLNDVFFIECIDQYPNNMLQIFNRWGTKVHEAKNYNNDWSGTTQNSMNFSSSEKLPVGTYYYILQYGDGQTKTKTGWLYITR